MTPRLEPSELGEYSHRYRDVLEASRHSCICLFDDEWITNPGYAFALEDLKQRLNPYRDLLKASIRAQNMEVMAFLCRSPTGMPTLRQGSQSASFECKQIDLTFDDTNLLFDEDREETAWHALELACRTLPLDNLRVILPELLRLQDEALLRELGTKMKRHSVPRHLLRLLPLLESKKGILLEELYLLPDAVGWVSASCTYRLLRYGGLCGLIRPTC